MHIFIHWIFVLALMLPNAYSVGADDDAEDITIDIFFVNDLMYGFYPVDSAGSICKEDSLEEKCKAGLARLVNKLVELNSVPEITSVSPTTPSETLPTTKSSVENFNEDSEDSSSIHSLAGFATSAVTSNSLLLNAGNTLHSHYNNWFDLLKFAPAVEALKSLNFSAIALGSEVLQYGEVMGSYFTSKLKENLVTSNLEVDSNITSFAEGLQKFRTFKVGDNLNVTIIGFMDKAKGELNTNGINITGIVDSIHEVIQKKKSQDKVKNIFIAIGYVGSIEVAREIGRIDGISIVIFSSNDESIVSDHVNSIYYEELTQDTCWIVSTKAPGINETHHLLGKLSLTLNSNGGIKSVNPMAYDYMSTDKIDDDNILKIEKKGQENLITKKEAPLARSKIALEENEISKENVFGDLVADAMLEAVQNNNNIEIAIWNPEEKLMKIEAEKNITEEEVHQILGSTRDQGIYAVSIYEKDLRSLLEDSVESLGRSNGKIFHTSGIYLEYGYWAGKGKRIQEIGTVNSAMDLEKLDLSKEKILLKIAVPEYLLTSPYLADALSPEDLGITIGDAVVEHIRKYTDANKYIKYSPLGLRYKLLPGPPGKKCVDNSGEAVLLTLAVLVLIVAIGLVIWYVIIPRIRQRRGSTMPLIY